MPADLRLDQLTPLKGAPVTLTVPGGCTLLVRGPSGAGKSLLLRAIADLDPNRGEAWLGDQRRSALPAHRWRRLVGYLPAESHWWADRVGDHHDHWPLEILGRLGFGPEVLDWELSRLSTGERQRLALARLLANRPQALLLDEPAANLDAANAARVTAVIEAQLQERRLPVLWVSHGEERPAGDCTGVLELEAGRPVRLELPWN